MNDRVLDYTNFCVNGTKLLDGRRGKPHSFFQFRSNKEPFPLDLGDFRLHVAATADCQRIR
jgi:hypothetical protein